ncbi:Fic/DOC family protein [Paenibacillus radicis (ex Gao et al. 2016)]|uniref:Fic/DOC family protein n=1 Tax=Paenibacillus radicis (ex Gao et al. 2016) TaxID=1737354 RepID=UPI001E2EC3C5|nr:Fic family protein [Paenibacillus radicis (ex Gao et al. 2016)]
MHQNPCLGSFDLKHLKAIHHYIFQDIYPFAGQIRDEDISKGFYFAPSQYILLQAKEIFRKLREESYLVGLDLEEFSQKAAELMGDINHLHPFREGNGRTQREFIRCLALRAGYKLDWSRVSTKETLDASIRSVVDDTPLADVIRRCII